MKAVAVGLPNDTIGIGKNIVLGSNSVATTKQNLNWMICTDHDHKEPTGFDDCCREQYAHLEYDMAKALVKNRLFSIFLSLPEEILEKEAVRILGENQNEL